MSIRASITTDAKGDIIVAMHGGLDYDIAGPLRQDLMDLMRTNPLAQITLDMQGVDFVGSSGISNFVETMKELNNQKKRILLQNVKEEFVKVFKLYTFDVNEYMLEQFESDETSHLHLIHGGHRTRTFEN